MKLTRLGTYLGIVVEDYKLDPANPDLPATVRDLLLEHKVVFFKGQHLDQHGYMAVARALGETLGVPETHPFKSEQDPVVRGLSGLQPYDEYPEITGIYNSEKSVSVAKWHRDFIWRDHPTSAIMLRGVVIPPVGGNTCWADMATVYESLDDETRERIKDLRVVHDWVPIFRGAFLEDSFGDRPKLFAELRERYPQRSHPLVLKHPFTGRTVLFTNEASTSHIEGLSERESRELLDELHRLPARPEFQVRFPWETGDVALWDNLATQHYGVADYWPHERRIERITFSGVAL